MMVAKTVEDMYHISSVHECGHAIGALMLGLDIDEIVAGARKTLLSGPLPEGMTIVSGGHSPDEYPDHHLIIAHCGMAAELHYYADMGVGRWKAQRTAKSHSSGDLE